ncbi:MAG TPA: MBL fold metallo-hydrolase, partial [Gemmataceae bacterium]|nr:MBL fold metallo-hydrolase [Gemmataceae bacterium]
MSLRFTVLGSGSAGNASLVEVAGLVVLLDIGLGPRQLASRFRAVGRSWADVRAALLTHTHSDHWNDRTLAYLRRLRIPLHCHADHRDSLHRYSTIFPLLLKDGLIHEYDVETDIDLGSGLRCRPLALRHDSGATFGFRFEGAVQADGSRPALGYAADLGTWTQDLAQALAEVDLLAIEFNHDVELEYRSGRSARLIARVLGDEGHLSNTQGAALLREVLQLSTPGRLRHVIQLHLSRE